ncbi:hypothetical protein [Pseudarthrobacter niigatensis]|uniref:Uncharacterized protein n=1 Tax=Pseudarthrobacter niigatensis TaxID=369935 RepID=A0AAJ1SQ15_9MICC|nr:hypothetical protein [Pseudarthrobacter niigatensis]MDQ0144965.1 hypothetical protein [Pseudarthrobacter niigatensis]MDQ0264402.1 hypothetical protein [Pseudarthrobacter niigatensis]
MNKLRSVSGETDEITEALQLAIYVDEVGRQAEIASRYLTRAWLRAMRPETDSHDTMVWGDLQAALFACIVIQRMLQPGPAFKHPEATRAQRQKRLKERARQLNDILHLDDEFPVLRVREIRNAFEHFDEGLDALVLAGRSSFIDWHISRDGLSMRTPPGHDGPVLQALRAFYPAGGTLHFGDLLLDIFSMDCALIQLKDERVPRALDELGDITATGPKLFGASQLIHLLPPDKVLPRLDEWLRVRGQLGSPVPFTPPVEPCQPPAFPAGVAASPSSDA